jgi:hypothetical protein
MSGMPLQLARSNRRHDKHSEPRPTIELMPAININELRHAIPRYHGQVNEPNVELKYPGIARLRLFADHIEVTGRNGYIQRFRIVRIRTGLGAPRAILVCSCGYGAIRLFARYGSYACRHCHKAVYASQKYDQIGRKRLQAAKLRLTRLNGWPDIHEALPAKPKWTRRRTYQRISKEIQALEAQAKQTRFRKQIDIRTFAYHVS